MGAFGRPFFSAAASERIDARKFGPQIHDLFESRDLSMFKLAERRAAKCGVYCAKQGLYLGGVPLIERDDGGGYRLRAEAEIEALLGAAYETPPDLARSVAGLRGVLGHFQRGDLSLAQIAALQLQFSDLREDRLVRLAQTAELFKANFDPSQARDDQGRWTDEGHEASNMIPAHVRSRSRGNPRAWEDFPNPDFRNRLAVAEQTADRPHYGYREVHDSRDLRGHRNLALGRYQMTPAALQAVKMMDRVGHWTGKYGIGSQAEFLANPQAQERALSDYMYDNERQLEANGAFDHIGATLEGLRDRFLVTHAGLLAAPLRCP